MPQALSIASLMLVLHGLSPTSAAPVVGAIVANATAPRGVQYVAGTAPPGALAWGSYDSAPLFTSGWALLEVHTPADSVNDTASSYAAGYLEGYFTALEMDQFASNTGSDAPNSKKLTKFLEENWDWMASQVAANATSSYWRHVGALMAQVQGLADGQSDAPGTQRKLGFEIVYNNIIQGERTCAWLVQRGTSCAPLTHIGAQWRTAPTVVCPATSYPGGDIFNLAQVYGISAAQHARSSTLRRLATSGRVAVEGGVAAAQPRASKGGRTDHCSALVRLTPGGSDIMIGHTTWSALENMQRILKRFDMPLAFGGAAPVPGRWTATSSYPGYAAYSSDDFYVMSSGIVSQETTIDNDNVTLAEEFASTTVVLECVSEPYSRERLHRRQ